MNALPTDDYRDTENHSQHEATREASTTASGTSNVGEPDSPNGRSQVSAAGFQGSAKVQQSLDSTDSVTEDDPVTHTEHSVTDADSATDAEVSATDADSVGGSDPVADDAEDDSVAALDALTLEGALTDDVSDTSDEDDTPESSSELDDLDAEVDESLAATIIQEIEDGTYVCLVCTCEIDRHLEIWTCNACFRVYDLDCIEDWAVRGLSTANKRWRCPACNVEHTSIPREPACWCGRTRPRPDSLIPFSCGNTCGSAYAACPHACSSVCHPGKHPECGALGPVMNCRCGKHAQQVPCLITPYAGGWQCDERCTTVVCALGHACGKRCHGGFCGPCRAEVQVRCYCGRDQLTVRCLDVEPRRSWLADAKGAEGGGEFVGGASCGARERVYYDCGVHWEEEACVPRGRAQPCKLAPEAVATCPCGKTLAARREKCTDPVPQCGQVCGKLMACGCQCKAQCHTGPCECFAVVEVRCACEHTAFLVPCKAAQSGFRPRCRHKCAAVLSCRKHVHREECCDTEQVALRRERENRKLARARVRTNFDDQVASMEPAHICTRPCNALKKCGLHYCEALCHSGPCNVCLELSSVDLVCACGKTVVPAPVRCGTTVRCLEPCARVPPCGHLREPHKCHQDGPCPKCTTLVLRRCACGAKDVAVLCLSGAPSCGKLCVVPKLCGHPCNRACLPECAAGVHAPAAQCQSRCRRIRPSCPHMCAAKCHGLSPCDTTPCTQPVTTTCMCGRREKTSACGASRSLACPIGTLLECDDECARAQRAEEVRKMFAMPGEDDDPYPEEVTGVYKRQAAWCAKFEGVMRTFVESGRASHHFPPMTKPQRGFLRALALVYKVYLESQDREPLRLVFICSTPRQCVPELTIRQALERADDRERRRQQLEELEQSQIDAALFNAILIRDVFFGVLKDDVDRHVQQILGPDPLEYRLQWMKESTYVFYSPHFAAMDKEKEDELYMLLKRFKKVLRDDLIAFDCKMCMVDEDVTCVLKTDLKNVAAPVPEPAAESKNAFDVLLET